MEPLWSHVVATGGKRRQIAEGRKRQEQAKSVATGCHQLPATFHGRRGSTVRVRQRGLRKRLERGSRRSRFCVSCTTLRYGACSGALRFASSRIRTSWPPGIYVEL